MSLLFYNISLFFYSVGIRFFSLLNKKARLWVKGRKNWSQWMQDSLPPGEKRIWLHAASMGEFEQGEPLIRSLRELYPQYRILLSFFSPSGYEANKDHELADHVVYLPMDSARNAKKFIELADPSLVIFIKYEFWFHYLSELQRKKIPVILISAAFRKEQPFFHWYGGFFRRMLHCYQALFVQDENSRDLLNQIGIRDEVIVAGDTRYDRVAEIAESAKTIPIIEQFKGNTKLIIAGSSWPDDEKLLMDCLAGFQKDWKLVIAPHEISKLHIRNLQLFFDKEMVLYSAFEQTTDAANRRVLVIDNIGMLSSIYAYGEIAFIGGGFRRGGIHNILEPAVFGLPILFGPIYKKFVEANTFVLNRFAFPIKNSAEAIVVFKDLLLDDNERLSLQGSISRFMKEQTGSAEKIKRYVAANILY